MPALIAPLLALLLLLPLGGSVMAATAPVTNLYAFELAVPDQSKATREQAVEAALAAVLVRVTGNRGIADTDVGKALLAAADSLLDQYRYVRRAAPTPAPVPAAAGATGDTDNATQPVAPAQKAAPTIWLLHGQFNARSIRSRLRAAGQALWTQPRVVLNTLLLVKQADGSVQQLVPGMVAQVAQVAQADPASGAVAAMPVDIDALLGSVAADRGLQIRLLAPLPANVAQLWQQPATSLPAVAGLPAEATLLVGQISHGKDSWSASWFLLQGAQVADQWTQLSPVLPQALSVGANRAVDWLAQRYAIASKPGDENAIALQVLGVNTLADYARVQHYLQQLDLVQSLEMLRASGNTLEFRLHVDGGVEALTRSLRLGGVLQANAANTQPSEPGWGGGIYRSYSLLPANPGAAP